MKFKYTQKDQAHEQSTTLANGDISATHHQFPQSSSIFSGREHLGISDIDFHRLDALNVTQPTALKETKSTGKK